MGASDSADGSRATVLIVDDVEANLVAVQALLRELDCEVVRATSGEEALRQLAERDFAAVLLDVQMPQMDGFEVARRARASERAREVPIIFVTGMAETGEGLFRGYESGAVDVLFKPLDPHVLLSKVKVFLELDRSRRRLGAEVEAHKRTLAELDAFNYSVAHDLRAPLRPIAGFARIVLEDNGDKLDPDAQELLGKVCAAAQRMDELIDDLLRLARISRTLPKRQELDLGTIVQAIVSEIRGGDPSRTVDVVAPASMSCRADQALVRIVLENLLRNAWKFTSKTAAAKIEVGSEPRGLETVYFVRDNGVGFDAAEAGKLFRAFQRLHSSKDFEGTGIGLAIVQRIIAHHGGRIWAEAHPNHGATFSFTLG